MRGTEFAEMSAFAAIAGQRSFAKAATQLGIGRSTLSQNLRALEERLGVRLLNRTTRKVSLTDVGRAYYDRCTQILAELEEAPVLAHFGLAEVLIDRGQLDGESPIQRVDNLRIALHGSFLVAEMEVC